jgi:hypothetical protein
MPLEQAASLHHSSISETLQQQIRTIQIVSFALTGNSAFAELSCTQDGKALRSSSRSFNEQEPVNFS